MAIGGPLGVGCEPLLYDSSDEYAVEVGLEDLVLVVPRLPLLPLALSLEVKSWPPSSLKDEVLLARPEVLVARPEVEPPNVTEVDEVPDGLSSEYEVLDEVLSGYEVLDEVLSVYEYEYDVEPRVLEGEE